MDIQYSHLPCQSCPCCVGASDEIELSVKVGFSHRLVSEKGDACTRRRALLRLSGSLQDCPLPVIDKGEVRFS